MIDVRQQRLLIDYIDNRAEPDTNRSAYMDWLDSLGQAEHYGDCIAGKERKMSAR